MPSFGSERGDVLYLIVCGAPPARRSVDCVEMLRAGGWEVCAIVTPSGLAWVDVESLGKSTSHPVRTQFRGPDDAEFAPRGDAVLVAPASFNTINKWRCSGSGQPRPEQTGHRHGLLCGIRLDIVRRIKTWTGASGAAPEAPVLGRWDEPVIAITPLVQLDTRGS